MARKVSFSWLSTVIVDGKLLGLGKEFGEDVAEDNKARGPETVMGVEEQTQQRGARDFELAPGHRPFRSLFVAPIPTTRAIGLQYGSTRQR
jgi:hypothetical protein